MNIEPITIAPHWIPKKDEPDQPFQEYWLLRFVTLDGKLSCVLKFSILISSNGFKQIGECFCSISKNNENPEKIAIKQTFDINLFSYDFSELKIGENIIHENYTKGKIESKGNSVTWDLKLTSPSKTLFNFIPESLNKLKMIDQNILNHSEDMRIGGDIKINGEKIMIASAPATLLHESGSKLPESWLWCHCNSFTEKLSNNDQLIFDGIMFKSRVYKTIKSPLISSFYFYYAGQKYFFNSLWKTFRLRSKNNLTEWHFKADSGALSFRGKINANLKDFIGITTEDTDGSYLYSAISHFTFIEIFVYKYDKLQKSYKSKDRALYEIGERIRNPYVSYLI